MRRHPLQLAAALALTAASIVTAYALPPHARHLAPAGQVILAAGTTQPAAAKDGTVEAGDLKISKAWTRAMLPGQPTGGGFFTVTNKGKEADRLVSVSSPAAEKTEIHSMTMDNNVMTMRPVAGGIEIPAGGSVELTPGGLHLMFMHVKEPFRKGGTVPLTLQFEKAGKVEIALPVMAAGAREMDHSAHGSVN